MAALAIWVAHATHLAAAEAAAVVATIRAC